MTDLQRISPLAKGSALCLWVFTVAALIVGWSFVAMTNRNTAYILVMALATIFLPAFVWFRTRGGTARLPRL